MNCYRLINFIAFSLFLLILTACNLGKTNDGAEKAFLASSDAEYDTLGIDKNSTAIWEDGMRTDGQAGSYEWWYNDAEFKDGTTVVVVFYSKKIFDVSGPARPTVNIDVTFPDGTKLFREVFEEGTVIDAAKDMANVKIQDSYLRYVDGSYELKFVHEDVTYKALMTSDLPMFRPETGHWYFGDEQEHFFAWFVAQPAAEVHAILTIDGQSTELVGHGYHDHNWGNIAMHKIANYWYWGRVNIGGYDIITAEIITEKKYGYTQLPVMFIAQDGEIINHDMSKLQIEHADTIQHPRTNKFIDNHLTFLQRDEHGVEYKLEYFRKHDIVSISLLRFSPWFKRIVAHVVGANPTYVRISGDVKLTVTDGENIQQFEHKGLWEQMFLGKNKEPVNRKH